MSRLKQIDTEHSESADEMQPNPLMSVLNFFSKTVVAATFIVAYFASGKDIIFACLCTIGAAPVQIILEYIATGRVQASTWWMIGLLVALTSLTLFIGNPIFVMWKPTLIAWGMALAIVTSTLLPKFVPSVEDKLNKYLGTLGLSKSAAEISKKVWVWSFLAIGTLNISIAYTQTAEVWVYFKFMGLPVLYVLTTTFGVLLGIYASRDTSVEDSDTPPARTDDVPDENTTTAYTSSQ